jgi:hypothetical protein
MNHLWGQPQPESNSTQTNNKLHVQHTLSQRLLLDGGGGGGGHCCALSVTHVVHMLYMSLTM